MSTQESRSHFGDQLFKTVRRIAEGMLSGSDSIPVCSGQLKLATALEFFQYRFSDSFGGNPPL